MSIYLGSNIITSGTFAPGGAIESPVELDGSTSALAAPSPNYLMRNGVTTSGMYWLNPGNLGANKFYIDFTTYPGKPMVMVISNRLNNGNGVQSLTYANATNSVVTSVGTYDGNRDFNLWVGLSYWRYLGNWIYQGVKGYQTSYTAGTHNVTFGNMDQSAKFKFSGWSSTYAFTWGSNYTNITGSYGTSGLYNYHVTNGYSLTTTDNNQDPWGGGNCSNNYSGEPWWYGACWDGSYFGGGPSGGYQNGPYWNGSVSNYFAYGAIYVGFDTSTMDAE
jgi:hypothetical protein